MGAAQPRSLRGCYWNVPHTDELALRRHRTRRSHAETNKGLRFGPEPFWMPGFEILERPDVLGLQTLGALRHLKLYALPFLQAAEAVGLDRREMHEDILATLAADESVTLGIVK